MTEEQYQGTLTACRLAMQQLPADVLPVRPSHHQSEQSAAVLWDRWWESGQFQRLADELDLEAHF